VETDGTAKRLLAEHEELKSQRVTLEGPWGEIARLVLPSHDGFGRTTPVEAPDPFVYDDSGEEANRLHAAVLNYLLTPDGQEWHGLAPAEEALEDDPAILTWCESAVRTLFKLRSRSAFASQIHECWLSVGAFGPGTMLIEDRAGFGPRYEAVPMAELWFSEGADGTKDKVHRRYELAARVALGVFGEALPEKLQKLAAQHPDRKIAFLHVVEPNDEREPGRLDFRGMPFRSIHLAIEGAAVVRRAGYRTMPYAAGRYLVAPGETYGRSPAWSCLPTLSMLNTMARNRIVQDNRLAKPPFLAADDDMGEPLLLMPDAINYGWLDRDGRPKAVPMQFQPDGGRFEAAYEQAKARIDRAFMVSLFLMLQSNPQMTATEVMERSGEKGIVLAPIMGRLQGELLRPMIDRELDIAFAMGALPPPPAALVESGGLKVTYTSPLAKLVAADEGRSIMETAQAVGALAQLDPSVLDRFTWGDSAVHLARGLGLPAELIRSDQEVARIAQQRQQQADAAAALEAAPVAAETAKTLADVAGRQP